jgi:hypothetical protein
MWRRVRIGLTAPGLSLFGSGGTATCSIEPRVAICDQISVDYDCQIPKIAGTIRL